jgi:hypothetical protein
LDQELCKQSAYFLRCLLSMICEYIDVSIQNTGSTDDVKYLLHGDMLLCWKAFLQLNEPHNLLVVRLSLFLQYTHACALIFRHFSLWIA